MIMDEKDFLKYKLFFDILDSSNKNKKQTEDDKTFRENVTNEITNRDSEYTKLLSHFVSITERRNKLKEFFKWTFYGAVVISMLVFTYSFYKLFRKVINEGDIEQLIETIPLLITSIVGFVSVIIAIPIAITQYLFSTKEDENITKIILHTQDHDTTGRQWTLDFKKYFEDINKDNGKVYKDDDSNKKSRKIE